MKLAWLSLLLAILACEAAAQSRQPTTPQPGSASVRTQLQALHYGNIQDLRRGPDGQWVGRATRNGVEKQVTIGPKGTVTER